MTTFVWKSPVSGDWDLASYWAPRAVPGSLDFVRIGFPGPYTVTVSTDQYAGSLWLTGADARLVVDGSLTVGLYSRSDSEFLQTTGDLGGTGTVGLFGRAQLVGGHETGTGTTVFDGLTTIGSLGQTSDALSLSGGRRVVSYATLNWIGGNIRMHDAELVNGGTFDASANGTIAAAGGSNFLGNAGTFVQHSDGTTTIEVPFSNVGTVSVASGTLKLTGGGSETGNGRLAVAAGATLAFGGGARFDIGGDGATGPGTLLIDGGDVRFERISQLDLENFVLLESGRIEFAGPWVVNGHYTQSGGDIVTSVREPSEAVTLNGPALLTGGAQTGAGMTVLKGATTIGRQGESGDALTLAGAHVLQNDATLNWVGGYIRMDSATLRNAAGATFDGSANGIITAVGSQNSFVNDVTVTKSGGTETDIDTTFVNASSVSVDSGKLSFLKSVMGTGSVAIAAGAAADFQAGSVSTQTVRFQATTGALDLAAPESFAGTIAGFGGGDRIDLLNTAANALSFADGKLTVHDGATQVAQLAFSGSYTTHNFVLGSDGHAGALITWKA